MECKCANGNVRFRNREKGQKFAVDTIRDQRVSPRSSSSRCPCWRLRWVATGEAPPKASRLQTVGSDKSGEPPRLVLDANGNAKGCIRIPWVDVPIARMSGLGNSGSIVTGLTGVTEPFDRATLDRLYPGGRNNYLQKFNRALDSAIISGFILPADKAEIEALAAAMYPSWK
jgi:hypothetical protein